MEETTSLKKVLNQLTDEQISRRKLIQRAGLFAAAATSISTLLAACADDEDATDDEDVATEPEETDDSDEVEEEVEEEETEEEPAEEVEEETEEEDPETEDTDDADVDEPDFGEGGSVTVLWRTPVTLNPLFSNTGIEQQVHRSLYGAILKVNDQLESEPDLADSVDVNEDATVYTFNLNENIMFTDGEQMTSDDVRFTFERAITPETGSIWRGRLVNIQGAEEYEGDGDLEGIVTPDDYTIEINLETPEAGFLNNLAAFAGFCIIPKHIWEDIGPADMQEHTMSMNPEVGAGPFKLVQYQTDQFLEMERNDDWFRDPPLLDRIYMRILEPSVGVAQLETGELDIMQLPYTEIERTEAFDHASVVSISSPAINFQVINVGRNERFADKRVRQALWYALDREGIMNAATLGNGTMVNNPIYAENFGPEWMGTPEGLNDYDYDPERARELLEEAGWDFDTPMEGMYRTSDTEDRVTIITICQQQWTEAGMQTELTLLERSEAGDRGTEGDFDIYQIGGGMMGAEPSISALYFTSWNVPPHGANTAHYFNDRVDELYQMGQATSDLDERREIYQELAQIWNDEVPWIINHSPNTVYGVTNRVQGFIPSSYVDNILWNAEEWTVED
jgi:ABC-type transport system substrate-binding protein